MPAPHESMLAELLREMRTTTAEVAALRAELEGFSESLAQVSKIVRGGNGHPALLTEVALLKERHEQHAGRVRELEARHVRHSLVRWEFVLAMLSGPLGGAVGAAVAYWLR